MPCSLVDKYELFTGLYCLYLQGRRASENINSYTFTLFVISISSGICILRYKCCENCLKRNLDITKKSLTDNLYSLRGSKIQVLI